MAKRWNAPLRGMMAANAETADAAPPDGAAAAASAFLSELAGQTARVDEPRVADGPPAILAADFVVWRLAGVAGERLVAAPASLAAAVADRALGRAWPSGGADETAGLAERLLAAPAMARFAARIAGLDDGAFSLVAAAASLGALDPAPGWKTIRMLTFRISFGAGGPEEIALAEPLGASPKRQARAPVAADARWRRLARALAVNAPAPARVVLTEVSMPASRLLELAVGDVVPLPGAATDRVVLAARGGPALFEGRLGEMARARAIRLHEPIGGGRA